MPVLKLTKAELAAVDAMMHVLRITASKGNLVAADAKTLAKIEKLTVSLRSKMTLADLLEFRRQATAPKG